jgi:hypothetical protein
VQAARHRCRRSCSCCPGRLALLLVQPALLLAQRQLVLAITVSAGSSGGRLCRRGSALPPRRRCCRRRRRRCCRRCSCSCATFDLLQLLLLPLLLQILRNWQLLAGVPLLRVLLCPGVAAA